MSGTTLTEPGSCAPPIDRARGRRTLLLLALVCVLPVAASYLTYYVWQPSGRVNYGELITPTPLPDGTLPGAPGQAPLSREALNGRWTLLYAGPPECPAACEAALFTMRQARLAQGKELERVARAWLVNGTASAVQLPADRVEGVQLGHVDPAAGAPWLAALPGAPAGTHLYLIDPLGNVMMRFPPQADIKRVAKDLQRLLKYSALGR